MKKIFLVHCCSLLLANLKNILEAKGYTVVTASTPQQAQDAFKENHPFDLMLVGSKIYDEKPFSIVYCDDLISRLQKIEKTPYARMALDTQDIGVDFQGEFVISTRESNDAIFAHIQAFFERQSQSTKGA